MGKASRDKGARGERMLKDFLNERGLNVRRGFTFHHESDLIDLPGIHVECKFVEKADLRGWMTQAEAEADKRKDGMPTVFWKKSRLPWLTVMKTEDWVTLYQLALLGGWNELLTQGDQATGGVREGSGE